MGHGPLSGRLENVKCVSEVHNYQPLSIYHTIIYGELYGRIFGPANVRYYIPLLCMKIVMVCKLNSRCDM